MTKGEWLAEHNMWISHVFPDEEADEEWIENMTILADKFNEIYEDEEDETD